MARRDRVIDWIVDQLAAGTLRTSSSPGGSRPPTARTWSTAWRTRSNWRYTVWQDAADDVWYRDWARSNMAAMSHLATGIALADENLGHRGAPFITAANMARLNTIRSTYDPDGRFHSWMTQRECRCARCPSDQRRRDVELLEPFLRITGESIR